MVAKILSLLNPLKKTYWCRLLKCVSPLLMGAVLAIGVMEPLSVVAAENELKFVIDGVTGEISEGETYNGVFYPIITAVDMVETPNQTGLYGSDKNITTVSYQLDIPFTVFLLMGDMQTGTYNYRYRLGFNTPVIEVDDSSFISLKYVGPISYEVINNSGGKTNFQHPDSSRFYIWKWLYDEYLYNQGGEARTYLDNITLRMKFNVQFWVGTSNYEPNLVTATKVRINAIRFYGTGLYSYLGSNSQVGLLQDSIDQQQSFRDEDQSDAEQAGSDMTGFASQLDNLKNTWKILWYPIEFTNRFVEVFTGGTQAVAYQDEYTYVTGYRYNDETGFLEPIQSMSVQPRSAGTGITFPSFELMGYTIWDSYTYDLSQVKEQVPEVFDAIYVIVSILEMLWFVGFLRSKYNEVFG